MNPRRMLIYRILCDVGGMPVVLEYITVEIIFMQEVAQRHGVTSPAVSIVWVLCRLDQVDGIIAELEMVVRA